jgi:hypothetical protein
MRSAKVLVTVPFAGPQREKLEEVARTYGDELRFCNKSDVTEKMLAQADALIGNVPPALLFRRVPSILGTAKQRRGRGLHRARGAPG